MIWYYIVIAMFLGIIAGFGYYEVTRSELKLNYELNNLVMTLRNTKRTAVFIGVIVGAIWPIVLVVLAAVLIFVSLTTETFDEQFDVNELKDVNLTNHNIVLDKPLESKVEADNVVTTWIDLNKVDETESDNTETTETNTKE